MWAYGSNIFLIKFFFIGFALSKAKRKILYFLEHNYKGQEWFFAREVRTEKEMFFG